MSEEGLFQFCASTIDRMKERHRRDNEEFQRREREERRRLEAEARRREEQRRLEKEARRREEQPRLEKEQRRREEEARLEEERLEEERLQRLDDKRKIFRGEEEARARQVLRELAAGGRPAPGLDIERPVPPPGPEFNGSAPPPAPEKDLSAECRRFFRRIQDLNASAAARHASLMEEVEAGTTPRRLGLILDDIKLSYGRELTLAARANCLRRELRDMLAASEARAQPEDFQARLRALLSAADLTEEDVLAARREFDDLADTRARRAVLENISGEAGKILKEMGYQVMDAEGLTLDRTQYLATPDPDCRIQCYINSRSGRAAFKQVRVVASEAEAEIPPTDYQKALDRKKGEKWCRTFDLMRDRLNEAGYPIEIMLRREPGQGDLPVVADNRLADGRRQSAAPAIKAQEQKLS
jgi:hypothetical protein